MRNEMLRQLVHLSGLAFITLAQLTGKEIAGILFMLAASFLFLYSEYVSRCEKSQRSLLSRLECRLRGFALMLERKEARRPFAGAFWFYFGSGLAFLLFPLGIACAAGATLAVSDSLSTIIGKRFGKRRIAGRKTLEGTAAFFASSLLVCLLFVPFHAALAGALAASLAELLPEAKPFSRFRHLSDDNLLIPLIGGLSIYLVMAA